MDTLYDLSRIQQIAKGNQVFVNKMVHLFIKQMPVSLAELHVAYQQNDFDRIRSVAHRIKPSVVDMGMLSIKNDIQDIELLSAENKHTKKLSLSIDHLDSALKKVIRLLNKDSLKKYYYKKEFLRNLS